LNDLIKRTASLSDHREVRSSYGTYYTNEAYAPLFAVLSVSKLAKAEFCSSEVFWSSAVLQFWSSYYYFSREQQALNIGHAAADGCLLMGPKKGDIFKI
jgi:hypothetical protein